MAQQAELLTLRKEQPENLISFVRRIQMTGGKYFGFSAFDTRKIDEYSARARESWGQTDAYREFERKPAGRSKEDDMRIGGELM